MRHTQAGGSCDPKLPHPLAMTARTPACTRATNDQRSSECDAPHCKAENLKSWLRRGTILSCTSSSHEEGEAWTHLGYGREDFVGHLGWICTDHGAKADVEGGWACSQEVGQGGGGLVLGIFFLLEEQEARHVYVGAPVPKTHFKEVDARGVRRSTFTRSRQGESGVT